MAELKLVVNDVKTGKSYAKNSEFDLAGRKIGEKISGEGIGLKGYELEITGGSDSAGFAMRKDIEGIGRKKALLSKGTGVHVKRKGMKVRKTIRGNTIGVNIAQVNLKILKYGSESVEKSLGIEKKEEKKEEKPAEVKEVKEEPKKVEEKKE